MSILFKRSLTGILIVGVITGGLLINSLSFFLVFLAIMYGTLWEFYHMVHMIKIRPQIKYGIFLAVVLYVLSFLLAIRSLDLKYISVLLVLFPFVFISELYFQHNRPYHNIAYTFLGILYIALPFSLFPFFVFTVHDKTQAVFSLNGDDDILNFLLQPGYVIKYSPYILLGVFIIHWMYDTGAYIVGKLFGKHKLFYRVSPRKTWEGLFGGAVIALLTGWLLSRYIRDLNTGEWLLVVFIIVLFGTLGDLSESLLKRKLGVKDSGRLLPGHGGLLDRFDGILLSTPVILVLLIFLKG